MTVLVVICSAVPALWLGYYLGRAGATRSTAHRRTRRAAAGKWMIRIVALMIVSQIQRSMRRKLSPGRARSVMSRIQPKLRRTAFAIPLPRLS